MLGAAQSRDGALLYDYAVLAHILMPSMLWSVLLVVSTRTGKARYRSTQLRAAPSVLHFSKQSRAAVGV